MDPICEGKIIGRHTDVEDTVKLTRYTKRIITSKGVIKQTKAKILFDGLSPETWKKEASKSSTHTWRCIDSSTCKTLGYLHKTLGTFEWIENFQELQQIRAQENPEGFAVRRKKLKERHFYGVEGQYHRKITKITKKELAQNLSLEKTVGIWQKIFTLIFCLSLLVPAINGFVKAAKHIYKNPPKLESVAKAALFGITFLASRRIELPKLDVSFMPHKLTTLGLTLLMQVIPSRLTWTPIIGPEVQLNSQTTNSQELAVKGSPDGSRILGSWSSPKLTNSSQTGVFSTIVDSTSSTVIRSEIPFQGNSTLQQFTPVSTNTDEGNFLIGASEGPNPLPEVCNCARSFTFNLLSNSGTVLNTTNVYRNLFRDSIRIGSKSGDGNGILYMNSPNTTQFSYIFPNTGIEYNTGTLGFQVPFKDIRLGDGDHFAASLNMFVASNWALYDHPIPQYVTDLFSWNPSDPNTGEIKSSICTSKNSEFIAVKNNRNLFVQALGDINGNVNKTAYPIWNLISSTPINVTDLSIACGKDVYALLYDITNGSSRINYFAIGALKNNSAVIQPTVLDPNGYFSGVRVTALNNTNKFGIVSIKGSNVVLRTLDIQDVQPTPPGSTPAPSPSTSGSAQPPAPPVPASTEASASSAKGSSSANSTGLIAGIVAAIAAVVFSLIGIIFGVYRYLKRKATGQNIQLQATDKETKHKTGTVYADASDIRNMASQQPNNLYANNPTQYANSPPTQYANTSLNLDGKPTTYANNPTQYANAPGELK